MSGELLKALESLRQHKTTDTPEWRHVALLYAGAVLHVQSVHPATKDYTGEYTFRFRPETRVGNKIEPPADFFIQVKDLYKQIYNENEQSIVAQFALNVAGQLGFWLSMALQIYYKNLSPLFRKKYFLPNWATPIGLSVACMLVPRKLTPFRDGLDMENNFTSSDWVGDGYDPYGPAYCPSHVLVLPASMRSRVHFLATLALEMDMTLAGIKADEGLRVASISLLPTVYQQHSQSGPSRAGGDCIRFVEDQNLAKSLAATVERALERCIELGIHLVVFPEYIRSPLVEDAMKAALQKVRSAMLVAAGTWHEDIGGDRYTNILKVYAASPIDGLKCICEHRKVIPYAHRKKKWIEELVPGEGLTYLITSLGVLAFGICKDFLFLRNEPAWQEFCQVGPVISCCPALTANGQEFVDLHPGVFNRKSSFFIMANACGMVKYHLLENAMGCCVTTKQDPRSMILAPTHTFTLSRLADDGTSVPNSTPKNGILRPCCGPDAPGVGSGDNDIYAVIKIPVQQNAKAAACQASGHGIPTTNDPDGFH